MEHLKSPCFILDKKHFQESVRGFHKALKSCFKRSFIGYSVKTNSLPFLLKLAKNEGCWAEVVSYNEYNLALLCGFEKSNIIYNGPMKSKETFLDAILNGAVVNVETKRELEWLKDLPIDRSFGVGIRLNVNISHISPEDAQYDDSRFGFSANNKEFDLAVSYINSLSNVSLTGIHIHRTSKTRSVDFYRRLVKYAVDIIESYHLNLDYIDIGGGYYGIFKDKPTFLDYAVVIAEELGQYFDLNKIMVFVEPGNAITASVFSYLSSVIDVKEVDDKFFITTDGTRNDIDPLFQKKDYIKELIYQNNNISLVDKQIITGCTCLEFDRLFELHNEKLLSVGDYIKYNNVGAYTMCLSPLFIRYIPKVYMEEDGLFSIIRDEWTEYEFIEKSKL